MVESKAVLRTPYTQRFNEKFHSVNTEQYGTYVCLSLHHIRTQFVLLIRRRPALKIVVLMLQYQTIDRNFCYWHMRFGFVRSFVRTYSGTLHTASIFLRVQYSLSVSSSIVRFANVFWWYSIYFTQNINFIKFFHCENSTCISSGKWIFLF